MLGCQIGLQCFSYTPARWHGGLVRAQQDGHVTSGGHGAHEPPSCGMDVILVEHDNTGCVLASLGKCTLTRRAWNDDDLCLSVCAPEREILQLGGRVDIERHRFSGGPVRKHRLADAAVAQYDNLSRHE